MLPATAPLLSVEHLNMRFGGITAVDDLSFSARRGDITALIGPNGAGKTTVFNCVTGFYKPNAGRLALTRGGGAAPEEIQALTLSGKRYAKTAQGEIFLLERMADFEIARRAGVARTFQNIRLFAGMTLIENLMVAQHTMLLAAPGFGIPGLLGLKSYRAREGLAMETARYWLDKTGLLPRADDPAGALPYGAQRRLEIARAMCAAPILLCLDEPAAGLNPRESAGLNALLLAIRDGHGTSILLIEHDMSVVMGICDHVVVLDYRAKIAEGPPRAIREDENVIKAYLGADEDADVLAGAPGTGA
jgi:branched-chain amino acid transport system ATP-binding protein